APKLTEEEVQLKLTRPFRSPLRKLQDQMQNIDQTQNIVMAKDGTTNIVILNMLYKVILNALYNI
ncbi:10585_t:CDS:1, partial [Cetraspora pellucida]